MPTITLPDGSQRSFEKPVSVYEVAESIGPGLAKATIGGHINERRIDAHDLITEDTKLTIFTSKDRRWLRNFASFVCPFNWPRCKTVVA